MKKTSLYIIVGILVVLGALYALSKTAKSGSTETMTPGVVRVVAAENFYGDIMKQLGGSHVQVVSILTNPNADPHEYESSVTDAEAIANANIVIENGLSYDTWMDKLLGASPNQNRIVLIAGKLAPQPLTDNPHVWYGVLNVQAIATDMTKALMQKDPKDKTLFEQNLHTFVLSLQPLTKKMAAIKQSFQGTPVGLTETIYLYQTQPEGLSVETPLSFERAIAEGNDPSAQDVATANDQITKKQVKVLIYNDQTITPITTNMQNEAKMAHIPVIAVWETMPPGMHYQSWMMGQLVALQNALQSTK